MQSGTPPHISTIRTFTFTEPDVVKHAWPELWPLTILLHAAMKKYQKMANAKVSSIITACSVVCNSGNTE